MTDIKMVKTIRHILATLVSKDYKELARMSCGNRMSAKEIAETLEEDGDTFIMPPESVFDNPDVVEVDEAYRSSGIREWSVNLDLWTEAGRSDLTLRLWLKDSDAEMYEVDMIECIEVM